MKNQIQKGTSPIILRVAAAGGANYSISQLWDLAKDADTPVKLAITKALQNSDGSVSAIENVSDKETVVEVVLNAAIARNNRGTVAMFMGHTNDPATLPGKALRLTLLDANGVPTNNKDSDNVGFSGPTTFVSFVWDEGSQTGEIRRYVNSAYDVSLGTMSGVFPIDDVSDDTTPVPVVCRKPVSEDDINA